MLKFHPFSVVSLFLFLTPFSASNVRGSISIVVSVPDQKLYVVRDGERVGQYRVSTSRFGLGDKPRSYATPLGKLEVAARLGEGLPAGAVLKGRHPTGEVLAANAKGRDPIVTRILHLRGLERRNEHAFARGIYIHGTPVERSLGRPDSYGCIRMRSQDVIAVFDAAPVGTVVEIVDEPSRRILPEMLAASKPADTTTPDSVQSAEKPASTVAELRARTPSLASLHSASQTMSTESWATKATLSAAHSVVNAAGNRRHINLLSVAELPFLGGPH